MYYAQLPGSEIHEFRSRERSFNSEQYDALRQEIRELVMRVTDGPFEGDDIERLNALLHRVPQARDWYVEECCLQCGLIWNESQHPRATFSGEFPDLNVNEEMSDLLFEASQSLGAISDYQESFSAPHEHGYCGKVEVSDLTHRSVLDRLSLKLAIPSLALVGCCWAVLAYLIFFSRGEYSSHSKSGGDPIAVLTGEQNCTWQSTLPEGRSPHIGQRLRVGETLVLRSGIAEFDFADGTVVTIQGPSCLELQASGKGYLLYGKLAAHVPPSAVGFEIETPSARIVDLGTDFRMLVDSDQTRCAVVTGKTDLYAMDFAANGSKQVAGQSRRLAAGHAVEVNARGKGAARIQDVEYDPSWLADIAPASSSRPVVAYQSVNGAVGNQGKLPGPIGLDFDMRTRFESTAWECSIILEMALLRPLSALLNFAFADNAGTPTTRTTTWAKTFLLPCNLEPTTLII